MKMPKITLPEWWDWNLFAGIILAIALLTVLLYGYLQDPNAYRFR